MEVEYFKIKHFKKIIFLNFCQSWVWSNQGNLKNCTWNFLKHKIFMFSNGNKYYSWLWLIFWGIKYAQNLENQFTRIFLGTSHSYFFGIFYLHNLLKIWVRVWFLMGRGENSISPELSGNQMHKYLRSDLKRSAHIQKFTIDKKSTILVQSSWNFGIVISSQGWSWPCPCLISG